MRSVGRLAVVGPIYRGVDCLALEVELLGRFFFASLFVYASDVVLGVGDKRVPVADELDPDIERFPIGFQRLLVFLLKLIHVSDVVKRARRLQGGLGLLERNPEAWVGTAS